MLSAWAIIFGFGDLRGENEQNHKLKCQWIFDEAYDCN